MIGSVAESATASKHRHSGFARFYPVRLLGCADQSAQTSKDLDTSTVSLSGLSTSTGHCPTRPAIWRKLLVRKSQDSIWRGTSTVSLL